MIISQQQAIDTDAFIPALHFKNHQILQNTMRCFLTDSQLDDLIREDVPYYDLTTMALGISEKTGMMRFQTRHDTVICGTEESAKIAEKCGCRVIDFLPSGSHLEKNQTFLEVEGSAEALHRVWKVSLNILEYASSIATRTHHVVSAVKAINPKASVVTTRKVFPGTKQLSVKGVLAGGGMLHRLGLSETVLIFKHHLTFSGGLETLAEKMPQLRQMCMEQKLAIEAESEEEAMQMAKLGFDIIQFDKFTPEKLAPIIKDLKTEYPNLQIAAAGGIHAENAGAYAKAGAELIVTTWPYFGKPADIGVSMVEK